MVLGPGLEPGTNRLKVYCSTNCATQALTLAGRAQAVNTTPPFMASVKWKMDKKRSGFHAFQPSRTPFGRNTHRTPLRHLDQG